MTESEALLTIQEIMSGVEWTPLQLMVSDGPEGQVVWLDGVSAARGVVVNGGFRVDIEGFKSLCTQFLALAK